MKLPITGDGDHKTTTEQNSQSQYDANSRVETISSTGENNIQFQPGMAPDLYDATRTQNNEADLDISSSNEPDVDFSEFMWMEHQDQYDQQVLRELEEEESNIQFELFQDSLEAEANGRRFPYGEDHRSSGSNFINTSANEDLTANFSRMLSFNLRNSTLNPNAPEFIPKFSK